MTVPVFDTRIVAMNVKNLKYFPNTISNLLKN